MAARCKPGGAAYASTMRFLYHARPRDMRGEVLYPLSVLRTTFSDLYEIERAKYGGREILFEVRVPILEVLWNEALHLSPLHPYHLAAAWRAAGLSSPAWDRDFFEIPVDRIDSARSVWFVSGALVANDPGREQGPPSLPVDQVARFDPTSYRPMGHPPARYLEYLRHQRERGRRPRPFAHLPHVLVAAPVDVGNLDVVRADRYSG